jgi:hypothetical protein
MDNSDDIEHRLRLVETNLIELNLKVSFAQLHLTSQEAKINEIHDKVLSWKQCGAPNLCLELREDIGKVNSMVEELKTDKLATSRGWSSIRFIAATTSAILAAGYALWRGIEYFVHRKP